MMMRRMFLFLVLAESILVNVQQKLGRRSLDLGRVADSVSRTIRETQQIQKLMLQLTFFTLGDYTMDHRLVETVVHVQTAHPFGATDADEIAEDCCEEQQNGKRPD